MGRLWVILIGAAMACAAAVSGGCTETRAIIDVDNLTGQPVRVEMLTVDKHGTKTTFATSRLVTGGNFTFGTTDYDRLPGMRARFTLESEPEGSEFDAVTLNMPPRERRTYDLRLINERLTARELVRGRPTSGPSGP